jgi:multicomponent Na+:H+ antiporter subunit F
MAEFQLAAAGFILLTLVLGLLRVLRGPSDADRLMSVQLLGTGSVAMLLLMGAATGSPFMLDVALTLALLAAYAGLAFVKTTIKYADPPADGSDPQ